MRVGLLFFFPHLRAEARAADVRESHSCEVRLEKRKLEGVCNERLSTLWGWGEELTSLFMCFSGSEEN